MTQPKRFKNRDILRAGNDSMEWATLGSLLTLLAVGMAVPGPNNSTCAAHASIHGRRSNIPLIIGLGIGFFGVNVLCGLAVNSF